MIGYTITEKNCNGILTVLYKERDKISEKISQYEWKGLDTTILEKQYNDICDQIDEACDTLSFLKRKTKLNQNVKYDTNKSKNK